MPAKPLPKLTARSPAESASHALRAALAERLAGRLSPQGEAGSTARLALEALAVLPGATSHNLSGAA